MEAATAIADIPLARDGTVPVAPARESSGAHAQPIAGALQCAGCERTPLVGEPVTMRGHRGRIHWLCSGCEHRWTSIFRFGRVRRTDRVRSLGGALNVRRK